MRESNVEVRVSTPQVVLFDLDGTLSDSADSIIASMRFAFAEHGLREPSGEVLRSFVGPPLAQALADLGYQSATIDAVVASYRRHYNAGALLETTVFPGVEGVLAWLQEVGAVVVVATSKPQPTARRIVEHLGLESLISGGLEGVYGSDPVRITETKSDVIGRALRGVGCDPHDLSSSQGVGDVGTGGSRVPGVEVSKRVVMVGDRYHDVEGAAAHGLTCIGVRWGYARGEELQAAGAVEVVSTPEELTHALAKRLGCDTLHP